MSQTEIYINAYPRSGTAWLTRLLNDILPQDKYIVRRGHFTLKNSELSAGRFYELGDEGERQRPKWFALSNITDEKLILLVRDPRDICVSGAWLWQQPVEQFLGRMIEGKVVRCGRWDEYCEVCLGFLMKSRDVSLFTAYEHLISYTSNTCGYIIEAFGLGGESRIRQATERQSFTAIKFQMGNNEQALRKAGLRKGIAGDWRNHFTEAMNDKIWQEFGWMMEKLGYERN